LFTDAPEIQAMASILAAQQDARTVMPEPDRRATASVPPETAPAISPDINHLQEPGKQDTPLSIPVNLVQVTAAPLSSVQDRPVFDASLRSRVIWPQRSNKKADSGPALENATEPPTTTTQALLSEDVAPKKGPLSALTLSAGKSTLPGHIRQKIQKSLSETLATQSALHSLNRPEQSGRPKQAVQPKPNATAPSRIRPAAILQDVHHLSNTMTYSRQAEQKTHAFRSESAMQLDGAGSLSLSYLASNNRILSRSIQNLIDGYFENAGD